MRNVDRIIGIAGLCVGVVALIAGYFFYAASIQERVPTITIDPVRTSIVSRDADRVSDLSVLYKGNIISAPIVAAVRIYFWNAGNSPILHADILKPIEIKLQKPATILEARVLSSTRDVDEFSITVAKDSPTIQIDFKILEKNDGGSIQIIYAGTSNNENIEFSGSTIGANSISVKRAYANPTDQPFFERVKNTILNKPVLTLIGILGFCMAILSLILLLNNKLNWIFIVLQLVTVGVM